MADIKYYGVESHFNENVTFYKDVNINGNLNYESLTIKNLTVQERSNLGITTVTDLSTQNLSVSTNLTTQNLTVSGLSTFVGVATFNDIDIKGAVETVSVAATYRNGSLNTVILECDHDLGTVFTHNIGTNGVVGVVSFKNFPTTKNSATTYTIIFTQQSTTPSGTGNTTASTGIGTNVFLKPTNVTGFTTSAKVGSATTVTLSPVANDVDIVSFMIHYNGGATGTASNYTVYINNNGLFRYGTIKP